MGNPKIKELKQLPLPSAETISKSKGRNSFGAASCACGENPCVCVNNPPGYIGYGTGERTAIGGLVIPNKYTVEAELMCAEIAGINYTDKDLGGALLPELTGLLNKFSREVGASSFTVTGRDYPALIVSDALSRADMPQLLQQFIFEQSVYNRGSALAFAPLHIDISLWKDYGIEIKKATIGGKSVEYVTVDWTKHGTPVPYLLDPLRCTPTNSVEYPYFYNAPDGGGTRTVLLHNSHVTPIVPGQDRNQNWGTSPTWIVLGTISAFLTDRAARIEQMANAKAGDLLTLSGVNQSAAQSVRDERLKQIERNRNAGQQFGGDPTIIAGNAISASLLRMRQGMSVDDYSKMREIAINQLALAFGVSIMDIETRGGVGYGAQADAQMDAFAMQGAIAMMYRLAQALQRFYPRVTIAVSSPRDPSQQLNMQAAKLAAETMTMAGYPPEKIQMELATKYGMPAPDDAEIETIDDEDDDIIASANVLLQFYAADKIQPAGDETLTELDGDDNAFWDAALPKYAGLLRAEIDNETEPGDGANDWQWLYIVAKAFYAHKSGLTLDVEDSDSVEMVVNALQAHLKLELMQASKRAQYGKFDVGAWFKSASKSLASAIRAAIKFGSGLTNEATDNVNAAIRELQKIAKSALASEISTSQLNAQSLALANGSIRAAVNDALPTAVNSANKLTDARKPEKKGGKSTERSRAWKRKKRDEAKRNVTWKFGATIEHCADCQRFVNMGTVKLTGSGKPPFQISGEYVVPGSRLLECSGCNCDCKLVFGSEQK